MVAEGLSFDWPVDVAAGVDATTGSGTGDVERTGSGVAEVTGSVGSAANTGNVSASGAWVAGL